MEPLPLPHALREYQLGLNSAAERARCANVQSTVDAREKVAREFADWLRKCNLGISLHTASPDDVVVFMERCYFANHHGRDGAAAPCSSSAVKSALGHLCRSFALLGREGAWDAATRCGNPCESEVVRNYRSGYFRQRDAAGDLPLAARPLVSSKLHSLVTALLLELEALPASNRLGRLVLRRDITLYLYLYSSHQRGGEGARLNFEDISTSARDLATGRVTAVEAAPDRVKNRQQRSCGVIPIAEDPDPLLCFIRHFEALKTEFLDAGLQPSGPAFRTLAPSRKAFTAEPLSHHSALDRFKRHLQRHNLYEGETLHSFRRGSAQAGLAAGLTPSDLAGRMLLNSTRVVPLYTDQHRPVRGPKRSRAEFEAPATAPPAIEPAPAPACLDDGAADVPLDWLLDGLYASEFEAGPAPEPMATRACTWAPGDPEPPLGPDDD